MQAAGKQARWSRCLKSAGPLPNAGRLCSIRHAAVARMDSARVVTARASVRRAPVQKHVRNAKGNEILLRRVLRVYAERVLLPGIAERVKDAENPHALPAEDWEYRLRKRIR